MTFLRIVIPLIFLFEHDLRANASRLSRGKTGTRFSGSCSSVQSPTDSQESSQVFAYIVRRLVLMLVTLFGISVIIFVLLRGVPGNIVDILFAAAGYVDPAEKANLERDLGLDQPIVVQYLHWIGGVVPADLGYSHY